MIARLVIPARLARELRAAFVLGMVNPPRRRVVVLCPSPSHGADADGWVTRCPLCGNPLLGPPGTIEAEEAP